MPDSIRWLPEFDGWEARCGCGWWAFAPYRGAERLLAGARSRYAREILRDPPCDFLTVCLQSHERLCDAA